MEFHHIGIATKDIEESISKLKKYLEIIDVSRIAYDANQDAYVCMLTLKSGIEIELVSGKVVETILKKRQYLYHTCYTVNNMEDTIKNLTEDGALLVREPREAALFEHKRMAFLMWDLGLIELLEEEK